MYMGIVISDFFFDNAASKWYVNNLRDKCSTFNILVIGISGTGKSTLINNLFGVEVAEVGDTPQSVSSSIQSFESNVQGVPVVLYDTPGLEDSRDDESEKTYLAEIEALLREKKFHAVICCFSMSQKRMLKPFSKALQDYGKIGIKWDKTVFALTFADSFVPPPKIKRKSKSAKINFFLERVDEWKQEISKIVGIAEITAICPTTGDPEEKLLTGKYWFNTFWLTVVKTLPPEAMIRFLEMFKKPVSEGEELPSAKRMKPSLSDINIREHLRLINMSRDQEQELDDTVLSKMTEYVPTVVGAAIGAIIGLGASNILQELPVQQGITYGATCGASIATALVKTVKSRKRKRI